MRLYWPKPTPPSILPAGEGYLAAAWRETGLIEAVAERLACTAIIGFSHKLTAKMFVAVCREDAYQTMKSLLA